MRRAGVADRREVGAVVDFKKRVSEEWVGLSCALCLCGRETEKVMTDTTARADRWYGEQWGSSGLSWERYHLSSLDEWLLFP